MRILPQLDLIRYERPTCGTIAQMPRKPDLLREQIKLLTAHLKADGAERRAG